MKKGLIKIDIVSDIVCPWCYIGKRRMDKAIDSLKAEYDFEVNYHPFELNPQAPKEGLNQKEHLIDKFGGEARYEQITNHVSKVAATEGLNFNFENQTTSPNTFDGHRIIWFAKRFHLQGKVTEELFKAYFTEGIDLSKDQNLIDAAVKAGIPQKELEVFLASDEGKSEVKNIEIHFQKSGVSGVPFYIINDKYSLSGAQPTEVFIQALTEIAQENSQGESCDINGENC